MIYEKRHSQVRQCWAALRSEIEEKFAALWARPELPNMEFFGSALLGHWLEAHGFDVTKGAYGIPTAFVATKGAGRPVVAILAEYDALPGLSNAATARREATGQTAGHACGHNHIGPANAGAAIAASRALELEGLKGQVRVIGCPSEEIVWGKIALFKRGAFDGVDVILTSHGDYQNGAISRPCQSVINTEIVFEGRAGHGGATNRQNALEAAEAAIAGIARLRETQFPDVSIKHVLRRAGIMPSITPDEVRLWVTARHVDYEHAREGCDAAIGICLDVARAADVTAVEQFIAETRGYLPNDELAEVLHASMQEIGSPQWSPAARELMAALSTAAGGDGEVTLDEDVAVHREGSDPFGQDDGEVSWRVPLGRVNWAYPEEIPFHHWAMTAFSGHTESNAGPLMASETLALAAVRLLEAPDSVERAKAELDGRIAGRTLSEPRLGACETMARAPETFWNATWRETEVT